MYVILRYRSNGEYIQIKTERGKVTNTTVPGTLFEAVTSKLYRSAPHTFLPELLKWYDTICNSYQPITSNTHPELVI